jgi:hypothetical protein
LKFAFVYGKEASRDTMSFEILDTLSFLQVLKHMCGMDFDIE